MRFKVDIEDADIKVVREILKSFQHHKFVKDRYIGNIAQPPRNISPDDIWWVQIMCLVTTQNRSGAGSQVEKFLQKETFPISLERCRNAPNIEIFLETKFSQSHLRFWKSRAKYAYNNYLFLEKGGWEKLDKLCNQLMKQRVIEANPDHYRLERIASQSIQESFKGVGPKQSRNFWQDLGLTRYEIPLDSRIMKWCEKELNFELSSAGLSDEGFYCQIMDALRELCIQAGVLPCMLDAAVFASFE